MKKLKTILAVVLGALSIAASAVAFSGCGYCQHKLEEIPKIPSTCVEQGERTSYECVKCHKTFGYTLEKGLYEITEREIAPLGKHTISASFSGKVENDTFVVYNECTVCNQMVEADKTTLFPFCPSDNGGRSAKHVRVNGMAATTYTFSAGTANGYTLNVKPADDTGTDPLVNEEIPFEANTPRYVIMFAYNASDIDVDIIYGSQNGSDLCRSAQTTIPAGEYAVIPVVFNHKSGSYRSWHDLVIKTALDREVELTLCGFYYDTGKPTSVSLKSTGSTKYDAGDTLDKEDIALLVNYSTGTRRVVLWNEIECDMFDRPITMEDSEVVLKYGEKTFSYEITVSDPRHFVTLYGATFADGTNKMLLDKNATLPADIVREPNKIFSHWVDSYGNTYKNGEFVLGREDVTLKAVYLGERTNIVSGKVFQTDAVLYGYGFTVNKLTDGIFNTGAFAAGGYDTTEVDIKMWIDLGATYAVGEVDLYSRWDGVYFPNAYYIEVSSDGENWTRVFTCESDEYPLNAVYQRACFFETVNTRYIRIGATKINNNGSGPNYLELGEIEVYGKEVIDG